MEDKERYAQNTQDFLQLLKEASDEDLGAIFQEDEEQIEEIKKGIETPNVSAPTAHTVDTKTKVDEDGQMSFALSGDEGHVREVPIDVPGKEKAYRSSVNPDGTLNPDKEALAQFGKMSPEIEKIVKSIRLQDEDASLITEEERQIEEKRKEILEKEKQRLEKLRSMEERKKPGVSFASKSVRTKALTARAATEKIVKNSKKRLLIAAIPAFVVLVILVSIVVSRLGRPYNMTVNGNSVGYIDNKSHGVELIDKAQLEASAGYGADVVFTYSAEVDFTRDGVTGDTKVSDDGSIINALKNTIPWQTKGYAIRVDGLDQTGYLSSEAACQDVLQRVKDSYGSSASSSFLHAEFNQVVEIISDTVYVNELTDSESVYSVLVNGRDALREYVVQSGDTLSTIAQANGISTSELLRLNPGVSEKKLKIGKSLKLNEPKPLLTVKMVVDQDATSEVNLIPEGEENIIQ